MRQGPLAGRCGRAVLGICLSAALAGCLPHYRAPTELARERDRVAGEERRHPEDPRYPQALYAIYLDMAGAVVADVESPLPLTDKVHARVSPGKKSRKGTCCLGGLAFLGDLLIVTPLRAVRTVVTMPVAWVARAHYRSEAEDARDRWQALEKQAPAPAAP